MAKTLFRLDQLVVEKGLVSSRTRARALIMAGKVLVDGQRADKPGHKYSEDVKLQVTGPHCPYVSRGGLKLQHALDHFKIRVKDLICMDTGASTGGFTHCLLSRGAARVYAVDVGYGQLDWSLRTDPRVVVMERTNIRYLNQDAIDTPIDMATVDTSFISLRLVIPCILKFLRPGGIIVALIKPQFEVGKGKVGKGGVVKDPALHRQVIDGLVEFFTLKAGLDVSGITESPILGPKGNREFLIFLSLKSEQDQYMEVFEVQK